MRPRVRAFRAAHGVSAARQAHRHPCAGESNLRPIRQAPPTDADHNGRRGQHERRFRPNQRPESGNKACGCERTSLSSSQGLLSDRRSIQRADRVPARSIQRGLSENPNEHEERDRGEERRESLRDHRCCVARCERTQCRQPQRDCCRERFLRRWCNSSGDQRSENTRDEINPSLSEHHRDSSAAEHGINRCEKCRDILASADPPASTGH